MKQQLLKARVQKLRREGLSFGEIAKRLDIKKSGTFSTWTRNIRLTKKQHRRLHERELVGGIKGSARIQKQRQTSRTQEIRRLRKEGIKEIGRLNKREFFVAGVGIYWSEGYTYSPGEQVGFTNSDPSMVLLMLKWFSAVCGISKERLTLHVKVNYLHKHRVSEIEQYWSKLTRIPLSQFTKTTILKTESKKKYADVSTYYGTLRITIRNGTSLRRKIHGWIEGLAQTTK